MFTRNVTMHLKPNRVKQYTDTLENKVIPLLRKQKGFKDEISFVNRTGTEATGISIWDTKEDAEKAFDLFLKTYEPKYPKATLCLEKDREELMAFYDFPAQHWQSIRTSNPIESTFGTIRHRTKRSKGSGELPERLIRQQLSLTQNELRQAVSCSLKREDYVRILKAKGLI